MGAGSHDPGAPSPVLEELRAAVTEAKGGDALAPVTVVVPSAHAGVFVRRAMAFGGPGPGADATVPESSLSDAVGSAGVGATTVDGLVHLLGAPVLRAEG